MELPKHLITVWFNLISNYPYQTLIKHQHFQLQLSSHSTNGNSTNGHENGSDNSVAGGLALGDLQVGKLSISALVINPYCINIDRKPIISNMFAFKL